MPQDVARFIEANIESVDQLEILRIVAADRDQEWVSTILARDVQAQPEAVAAHLEALERRGLLTVTRRGPTLACRYGPRTPDLESELSCLLKLYNERPVTLIRMLYARAARPLKSFADAFRIRQED